MIERAVTFGAGSNLVGILTEPDSDRVIAGAPALLMWNVGVQHRVGPYRIQVDLARELARRGFASLRFDLSGMGDSEVHKDGRPDGERALDDIREAMALLEKRRSVRRFVPIGFCSSVDSVHTLALADERIVGACFIEGYAYRTRGFWMHYPLRMLDSKRWKRRIAQKLSMWAPAFGKRPDVGHLEEERAWVGSVFTRQYPSRAQFAADVRRMASRARLLFVYVGGDTDFNHSRQFEEMVGAKSLGEAIELVYYRDADHTFYREGDRRRAVVRVGEWASKTFGEEATANAHARGSIRPDANV